MKLASYVLLVTIIFNNLAIAESIVLHKDEKAPFTGILMDEQTSKNNQKDLLELDTLRSSISLYKENTEVYKTQVDFWRNGALEANKELISKDRRTFWENLGYFAIGCAITTSLAFAVNKATK